MRALDKGPVTTWFLDLSHLRFFGPQPAQAMIINKHCLMLPVAVSGRNSYSLHGRGILELFDNIGHWEVDTHMWLHIKMVICVQHSPCSVRLDARETNLRSFQLHIWCLKMNANIWNIWVGHPWSHPWKTEYEPIIHEHNEPTFSQLHASHETL